MCPPICKINPTADKLSGFIPVDLRRYSMQNAENKSKKFVVLATYVVAVICLLAGLFVPLFVGNNILALKLGEIFKSLLNKENSAIISYPVQLFGIEKLHFDFLALVIVLYLLVTALAVIGFAPVVLSVRKEGKIAKKIYYGIEIAAIIVLSLFFVVALQMGSKNYNLVIALCGTVVALLVLSGMDKGKTAVIKIVLFLLSAIGFLALFDIALLSEKFAAPFNGKLSSALTGDAGGANYLTALFAEKISDVLALLPDVKNKVLLMLAAITATIVLINFFIDTVKLATGKDGKIRNIINIARYGLELAAAAGTLILAIICKEKIGVMLIAILVVAAIQLAISIIRFVIGILRKPDNGRFDEENEDDYYDDAPVSDYGNETPVLTDDYSPEEDYNDYNEEQPYTTDKYKAPEYEDDGYPPHSEDEYKEPEYEDDDDGYISPEEDALANREHLEEPTEEATEEVKPLEEEIDYEIKTDGTYLLPAEDETVKEEPAVEEPEEEVAEAEPEKEEPAPVEEPEKEPEPEEIKEPEKAEESLEETVPKPYHEEIKPYNPYEKHSHNPFRNFEQPPQPYNPYAQQTTDRPVQTERPVQPMQPARPAYEPPKREQKPVQSYKPYEPATERPQSVRPLRPSPIIQEFKPVPPISEHPQRERQVYTVDKLYAGPIDDFIRKLSNDERIEFATVFLEKSRGALGSIPDYIVGGDNKKFFSLSFIYLGRVRGLVSDGLLNKMYKELNML